MAETAIFVNTAALAVAAPVKCSGGAAMRRLAGKQKPKEEHFVQQVRELVYVRSLAGWAGTSYDPRLPLRGRYAMSL